jgi:hypothetical protein
MTFNTEKTPAPPGSKGSAVQNSTKSFGFDSAVEIKGLKLKKNGRHEETRTPDLYRVKVAL